jgi:amidohydrolase
VAFLDIKQLKDLIIEEVDANRDEVINLSRAIHENPELGMSEHKAVERLCHFLADKGFDIEKNICDLPTAFRAVYGSGKPVIGFLAEYDALPELGHACGHNIIAASSAGAGVAARKAVDAFGGTIEVIGTPAEELIGGKIIMAQKGAFSELDAALMVHPASHDSASTEALACQTLEIEFFGKPAHAAGKPEEGINALEAMILSFNAVNSLRQHILSKARIHGIITDGGSAANVVPDHSAGYFLIRSPETGYMEELKEKVLDCFKGAALSTGARLEYRWDEHAFEPLLNNMTLCRLFADNMKQIGRETAVTDPGKTFGSTDFGNVSQLVPGLHGLISITGGTVLAAHTPEFKEAAGSERGMQAVIDAAKGMAMTAADLLGNAEILKEVKHDFNRH